MKMWPTLCSESDWRKTDLQICSNPNISLKWKAEVQSPLFQDCCIWNTYQRNDNLLGEKSTLNLRKIVIPQNFPTTQRRHDDSIYCSWVALSNSKQFVLDTQEFLIKVLGVHLYFKKIFFLKNILIHMGQNSKQINIAKYVSKFLIYGAKMLKKCVKSQKKNFCTLSFFAKSS